MTARIIPGEGLSFEGASLESLRFGDERERVEESIGEGFELREAVSYFDGDLAITYKSGVDFIEFKGIDCRISPTLEGIPLFEVEADELVAKLEALFGESAEELEGGHLYEFKSRGLSLWREAVKSEVEEYLAEAAANGDALSPEIILEEKMRADRFCSVGVGRIV